MKRLTLTPRPDWVAKVESVGLTYHTLGQSPEASGIDGLYWDESVAYAFTADEIDVLEAATNELHRLCLAAVEHVVRTPGLMDRFLIPKPFQDYVARSWNRRDPHLYGRFDLAYDPTSPDLAEPKLLEYNADTPTTLIESAVVQWFWLEDTQPGADQFNSIHERLVDRWRWLKGMMPPGQTMHFWGAKDGSEEEQHILYFMDTAQRAGLPVKYVPIDQVGWREKDRQFVDLDNRPMGFCFKLYPWEWLAAEAFGPHLLDDRMGLLEPVWKMVLSNKAILPVLWELFPGHPNLLPASFDATDIAGDRIAKPILAREGANIELVRDGATAQATGGAYGVFPCVHQQAVRLPRFDGQHVVLGSWVVGDEACGLIVRESSSPIVTGTARVVPHLFR